MISTYDIEYKIVLIGDQSVGKTSIIRRFTDETYEEQLLATIGVTFTHKILSLAGRKIKLNIFDSSGQEKFHSIAPSFYNNSQALVLCFDITNPITFKNLMNYWLSEVENHNRSQAYIFLVANKIDCGIEAVSREQIQIFANKHGVKEIYFVSAKQNKNIEQTLTNIAKYLQENPNKQKCEHTEAFKLEQIHHQHEKDPKGCCSN